MSLTVRGARRLLWLAFLVTVPLPFYLGALEFAPVARLLFLSVLVWGVVATEGTGGFQGLFALLAGVQVLLWGALLWGAAALLARASRHQPNPHRTVAVWCLVVALFSVSLTRIYRTPLSSTRPVSDLFGLFD